MSNITDNIIRRYACHDYVIPHAYFAPKVIDIIINSAYTINRRLVWSS